MWQFILTDSCFLVITQSMWSARGHRNYHLVEVARAHTIWSRWLELTPYGRGDLLRLIPPGQADLFKLIEVTTWSRQSAHGFKITTYSRWSTQPFAHFYLEEIIITLFNSSNARDYLIFKVKYCIANSIHVLFGNWRFLFFSLLKSFPRIPVKIEVSKNLGFLKNLMFFVCLLAVK